MRAGRRTCRRPRSPGSAARARDSGSASILTECPFSALPCSTAVLGFGPDMYKASAGIMLPPSIIGSLPRPSWYTAVLGKKSFLEAMVNSRYREQYEDAVSCFLRAQEVAGLDICTDGDAHYDEEVGGLSWQDYPLTHMDGFAELPEPMTYKIGAVAYPRGHILHDFLAASVSRPPAGTIS